MVVTVTCPACWQPTAIELAFDAGRHVEQYEDCQLCCRPMHIQAHLPSPEAAEVMGAPLEELIDIRVELDG